jgi:hypothetical protein
VKKAFSFLLVVGVICVLAGQVWAGKKQAAAKAGGTPGTLLTEVIVATATVEEVDYPKRILTLRAADGQPFAIKVDKRVDNFDQIKKGDQVKAEVLEALGVYVRKPDWPPAPVEVGNVAVGPKGRPPAAVVVDIMQLPGTVEAVDHAKRTVTLKGPEGKLKTFVVDQSVKRFEKLKKGDEIVLVVTEAIAISVQKP